MPTKKVESVISAVGVDISIVTTVGSEDDFISLTDMARYKNSTAPKDVVKNWLRLRSTIEFLGLWEELYNPSFKGVAFDSFKIRAGENAFTLSPQQWIKATGAIGLISKSGRYGGGTYAHKDIAFEFASWLSPEFKLLPSATDNPNVINSCCVYAITTQLSLNVISMTSIPVLLFPSAHVKGGTNDFKISRNIFCILFHYHMDTIHSFLFSSLS